MSDVMEFGFDDAKVIKNQGVDQFKQSKNGEKTRVTIVAFKKFSDVVLGMKAKEQGRALTDTEKADWVSRTDKKIAEQLNIPLDKLTEADRLDIKQPRFAFAFTHYNELVGTIRCLSKYEGSTIVRAEACCDKFGDADQTVGSVIMTYPVEDNLQVDEVLLKARKYTGIHVWKMNGKKFKRVESAYVEARNDKRYVIDLSVLMEGDPKFQKQTITALSGANWARENGDPDTRKWVLDQGLRSWKHVGNSLGFEMSKDKLMEKLGHGGSSHAQMSADSAASAPQLVADYDKLIT